MNQTAVLPLVEFAVLKQAVQRRFNQIKDKPVYRSAVNRDELWAMYLASFPDGTNPMFRERTEHDCSSCRAFIKNVGSLVVIIDGEIQTMWDMEVGGQYQPVVDTLAMMVRACPIDNLFLHGQHPVSTDKNFEETAEGVRTWEHLHVTLPDTMLAKNDQIGPRLSEARSAYDVMLRSLREITLDAVETVQDLIGQNSLYRGEEKKPLVDEFARLKRTFDPLTSTRAQELFAWQQVTANAWVCRVRNDVVGTLLVDLSEGVDLEKAVKSFEDKVSGTNYKRPTALVTPKMRDAARAKIEELGLMPSLERRFARLEDISVNNVLWADRSAKQRLAGDVWDDIPTTGQQAKNFDRVEEITIEKFIADVLPTATSIEVMFENRHRGNLVSLVAPYDLTAKPLFKWSNPFSWSYAGDVADSDLRQRVAALGGRVDGVFRFSHSWNYGKRNASLMDLHVFMPGSTKKSGDQINDDYGSGPRVGWNKRNHSPSGGIQDVDYVDAAPAGYVPVENTTFPDLGRMPDGEYRCMIHNWALRGPTQGGFKCEIEFGGQIHQYEVDRPLKNKEWIHVATVTLKQGVFSIEHHITSEVTPQTIWSIKTQDFRRVTAIMLSPNHWDGQPVGNRHFFFMLDGCQNDGSARGFYNEFLASELEPHRKTMELIGSRMRTEDSGDQMSGLGFSSTQRNSVVVKVGGSFSRTLRVTF